jgi:AAA domain
MNDDLFGEDEAAIVLRTLPCLDWHELWEQEEEQEWLIYPLLPARRLVALYSAAKTGKSLLMLEIAAALATSREVLGQKSARAICVLYVDFENDPRGDVRTRLEDMGYGPGDLGELKYLSFPSLSHLDTERGALELMAAVGEYSPEVVIIDTISRAVGGEENDNDTWNDFYKHTGLRLKQAGVAMMRLDHAGKDETKGQRGGSAKNGDVDAVWWLSTITKEERFRLECTMSRFRLDGKELTLIRHDDPLRHSVEQSSKRDDREAKILELIELANLDGLPAEGRDKFDAWLKTRSVSAARDIRTEAVRRRKNQANLVFDPSKNLSSSPLEARTGQSVRETADSNGQVNQTERKNLSEMANGQVRTGEEPNLSVLSLSIGEDRGQDDGQPGGTRARHGESGRAFEPVSPLQALGLDDPSSRAKPHETDGRGPSPTNGAHSSCEVCQEPIHAAMARLGVTRCRKHPVGAEA